MSYLPGKRHASSIYSALHSIHVGKQGGVGGGGLHAHDAVMAVRARRLLCARDNIQRLLQGHNGQAGNAPLLCEQLQLLLACRAAVVEGDEQHASVVRALQHHRQLGARGGLAAALHADHEVAAAGAAADGDGGRLAASEQLQHLVVDDAQHGCGFALVVHKLLAHRPAPHALDKGGDDRLQGGEGGGR